LGGNVISGTPPCIISTPDGEVNTNDLLIFIQMWRWSRQKKGLEADNLTDSAFFFSPQRIETEKGKIFSVEVKLTNGTNLLGCGLGIRYDPSKLKLNLVEEGDYFKEGFPFNYELIDGLIRIDDAGIDIENGVSGSGLVAKLKFEALTEDPTSKIEIAEDSLLLGVEGVRGYTAEAIQVEPAGPAYSALFQSVPNPAIEGVWIPYQLAEGAEVEIRVYNILGQVVKNIEVGYKPKMFYKSLEQTGAARWDLTNNSNQRVANGLYFYQLKAGKFSDTKAMAISR
ncbi:MAG: cohesin domain-containing protein, partial [Candidatus Desantisbacteria bacterium]